ncbi:hypothetical protein [Klebsiella pneumoniae]|uniref:hypothetical protein n=1 Tax=Klebsiella pneumoniae TaxID=573 RepID=UPI0030154D9E
MLEGASAKEAPPCSVMKARRARRVSVSGPYLLVVELASMLLLAAAGTAFHLGRNEAKEQ